MYSSDDDSRDSNGCPWLTTVHVARQFGVSATTVISWINNGAPPVGGGRVYLVARKIGGRYFTKQEWVDAFIAACNPKRAPVVPETPSAAQRRARREQEEAARMLGENAAQRRARRAQEEAARVLGQKSRNGRAP